MDHRARLGLGVIDLHLQHLVFVLQRRARLFGGFSTAEALTFLRSLRGLELAGCDVVEVAPPYDGPGQVTALAAANVLYELLSLRAVWKTTT